MATAEKHRTTSTDTLRAAIYVRISVDSTGEGLGVERQEEDARAILAARGWELAGVYSDNSISASDAKKFRPRYADLQRDYAEGLFDALIVWDLDRLTRQPRQLEDWIEAAEGRGLALVTTNGEADLTTDGGRMYARIKLAVARGEIERKSARHKRALRQHAQAGRIPHGPRLLGYTASGLIVPDEAEIVRGIFSGFLAGESLRSIKRRLTDDGVPTRSGRPWNTRTIRDMLSNPRYAGWVLYQREIMLDEDGNRMRGNWEPLIDADDFDVVQVRLADPARKTNHVGTDRRYLGSSLFLCDECGQPVQTINGGKYSCPGHVMRTHEPVDEFVIAVIAERLSRPDFVDLLAPDAAEVQPFTDAARQLRRRLEVADNDYASGDIDAKLLKKTRERVGAELAAVEAQMTHLTSNAALSGLTASADPAGAFRSASVMGQRAVIAALCEVRLRKAARGRPAIPKFFDPSTVVINWRQP